MATSLIDHVMSFLNDWGSQHQEHCLGICLHEQHKSATTDQIASRDAPNSIAGAAKLIETAERARKH